MKSIFEYLIEDLEILDHDNEQAFQVLLEAGEINGFNDLITQNFIIKNSVFIALPKVEAGTGHKAIIDACIIELLKRNLLNNVLTFGYKLAKNDQVNSILNCESINFNVQCIKGAQWGLLHKLVGTHSFMDILMNCTVININEDKSTQIIGNRLNDPHTPPNWLQNTNNFKKKRIYFPIKVSKMLYKHNPNMSCNKILYDKENLMNMIFDFNYIKKSFIDEDKLKKIIDKMYKSHEKSIKYFQILDNICPKNSSNEVASHLDYQTPVSNVNKFLTIILEKLLPIELLGSKKNKSIIFKNASRLLRQSITSNIPFNNIIEKISTTHFSWLQGTKKNNLQENLISQLIIDSLVAWIFQFLIPRIVSSFFYCTNVSSTIDILYFRHDIWNVLSFNFLKSYFPSFLTLNQHCRNHNSYLLSDYNHSRLRILPKKANNEFRILAVPNKGVDEEEILAYNENVRTILSPVNDILNHLRRKRKTNFEKLYSLTDIAEQISNFKTKLLKKYHTLPELHFMKFDIKDCYDTIPRQKVLTLVKKLLENEEGFYVRRQSFYDLNTQKLKTVNVVNCSKHSRKNELFIDSSRTLNFQNEDIIHVLETELYNSSIMYGNNCYLRKDGIFQGSYISAVLVDLLYDDLLEYYPVFHPDTKRDFLVLRLADDFLMISNDQRQIQDLNLLCANGFQEYNATVKKEKILISSSQTTKNSGVINFCSLNINMKILEIWKEANYFNVIKYSTHSKRKIFHNILMLYKGRLQLQKNNINISDHTIIKHVENVLRSIIATFMSNFRKINVGINEFKTFLNELIRITINIYSKPLPVNRRKMYIHQLVTRLFLKSLLKKRMKYKHAIFCLYENLQMQLDT
ncbi:hypothetical protein TPHA_0K01500 [Tetrapisispora phaffii CBS 4417]|uniref:Telomerase reverse transcriptase n=1 Tax=Tetrapisispora phaffii (strain ATCC 24235 / CBS 4417 / NBRC 1672 / NRRL Y-8282 / UCD 70-5) TaxID=1071381 RepID=G8BZF5_TETPH|nr:hypothetical protein TPHA_0K01500 [Tetrapisispora phaffii CBS 4417]CCE65283.1 hypothetical protein TPHA_0K01500 [Tetrapisispora phaffii CBS 4417]